MEIKTELSFGAIDLRKEISQEKQSTDLIADQWDLMVFEKGGCLVGEQYVYDKELKREPIPNIFIGSEWEKFAKNDKTKLTEFLIIKLKDTTKTKVHTCPFFGATVGEMAIYSLQHIHGKNWFDFKEFEEYKNKEYGSATDQPQMWLRNLLVDETEREKLTELYRSELKK